MPRTCIPRAWPGFSVTLRHGGARYVVTVANPDGLAGGIAAAALDGAPLTARPLGVTMIDDGATHRLLVRLG